MINKRDKLACFERANDAIIRLDCAGEDGVDIGLYRQFQLRNAFGLDPDTAIYRIFQQDYYDCDVSNGCLTLPRASANVWTDNELENPLEAVTVRDYQTGQPIHLGSSVRNYYALCCTHRREATEEDWDTFSHGKSAVRIGTTVGKLFDRVMDSNDEGYMLRSWLVDVDYQSRGVIKQMQTPEELYRRMESTGAMLALSAAIVGTSYGHEDEVRFLFDNGPCPRWDKVAIVHIDGKEFARLPFDWAGFVDSEERRL
jgi:hypothetical protein